MGASGCIFFGVHWHEHACMYVPRETPPRGEKPAFDKSVSLRPQTVILEAILLDARQEQWFRPCSTDETSNVPPMCCRHAQHGF